MTNDELKSLRKAIISDIALALGVTRPPAFLSKAQVVETGFRSASILEHDQKHNKSPIIPIKVRGQLRYPLHSLVEYALTNIYNGAINNITEKQLTARLQNLEKARQKRRCKKAETAGSDAA